MNFIEFGPKWNWLKAAGIVGLYMKKVRKKVAKKI